MIADSMQLDIVSAESRLFEGKVSFLSVTGALGELGIAPGHMPLMTALKPGQITFKDVDGKPACFYISGGFLEVQPTVVTVLADTAIRAENLDEAASLAAKERAEKVLSDQKSGMEYTRALAELAQARAQLRALKNLRDYAGL